MNKLDVLFEDCQKAIDRLSKVLKQEKNEFIRDSAIKRFEFTFDLYWKLLKTFLEENLGVICNSPKGCFREAFTQQLIDYDDFWLKMTDWRNASVHMYKEELAEDLYRELPKILNYFQNLLMVLKDKRLTNP